MTITNKQKIPLTATTTILIASLVGIPFYFADANIAFAEPLEHVETSIDFDKDSNSASIYLAWNLDENAAHYEVGCVSCIPNTSETTQNNEITINNVTPFPDTASALLYIVTYNSENEIVNAEQLFLNLENENED